MKNRQSERIGNYVLVTSNGEVRQLGHILPENLDSLWGGKILGFPLGADEATKDRFISYVVRGFLPRLRFRRAGIQLYALQSASKRLIVVDGLGFIARSFSRIAGVAVAILVTMSAILPMAMSRESLYATETLNEVYGSFLSFAIKNHLDDDFTTVVDIEKVKAERERFVQWQKENGYVQ